MNRPVSRATVISAIVRKDLAEYGRDRLWAFLTVLVIVIVIALFWILPDDVDESINAGVSGLEPSALAALGESEEGLLPITFPSEPELRAVIAGEATAWVSDGRTTVVADGVEPPSGAERVDVSIGLAFPDDFLEATASGRSTEVTVFVDGAVPDEIENAMSSLVREIAFGVAGEPLPVETAGPAQTFVILGEDRAGNQVSARDGFRPIFVFLILMMEMFVMASLIAKEIQDRTVTAVLVTPATVGDVLVAKGVTGAVSGLAQAVIVLLAINSFSPQPLLILTLMLLGSVMISGTAMLAGSSGKDFMSTLFWGMAYMVPLLIPAFAALFPGTASAWVRVLPSFPLVQGLVDVTTYGAGWADTLPELGALLAWCVGLFGLGFFVLKRKVESL